MRRPLPTVLMVTAMAVGCGSGTEPDEGGPAALEIVSGAGQTGTVTQELPEPVVVEVSDSDGNPVVGVGVTFFAAVGSGSADPNSATTDGEGRASTRWRLGAAVGQQQLAAAAVEGSASATVTATGIESQFDIEVRFLDPQPSATQMQVFAAVQARWEALVVGDLPDVPANISAGSMDQCIEGVGAVMETIDDLVIYARIDSIDGPTGAIGQARPCFLRSADTLPFLGQMILDEADVDVLESSGFLDDLILHEMAHVLGFGTLWTDTFFGLLADPSCPDQAGVDAHFTGQHAIEAFDDVGGDGYTGAKVPVENSAGAGCPGTRDGHWRESELEHELMTGTLENGSNPLSIVSAGSLWDLGYMVDYAATDAYAFGSGLLVGARPGSGAAVELHNDVAAGPVFLVDADGRIARTIGSIPGR